MLVQTVDTRLSTQQSRQIKFLMTTMNDIVQKSRQKNGRQT
jgi:hypothetical protein